MEGLSVAANSLAVISVAFKLTEACLKLYRFWETVEDAPQEISAVKEDLQYLISIFKRIESGNGTVGECIAEGIQHCRVKVGELTDIVEKFDIGFHSPSRTKRKWAAFKAATQSKHVQRFRDSLSETKSTLTLALVHQCVQQTQPQPTAVVAWSDHSANQSMVRRKPSALSAQSVRSSAASSVKRMPPFPYPEQHKFQRVSSSQMGISKKVLQHFEQSVSVQDMSNMGIEQLMLHCIQQTAMKNFEAESLEIFAHDGYTIDASGAVRSRTFVYSESLRYRVCHQTSSFRTALGCVWIRTTVIYQQDKDGEAQKSQTVTSFVFYPTHWLRWFGLKNGLEAIIASAGRTWLFNCRLTVTRVVPENSLIFKLCAEGQTRAVELLLSEGRGSVVDTTEKGWKPLHFAAANGHVELCAMLIELGADKTALVYEGPNAAILSPISLFVSSASTSHAEKKISMLRLFADCIDLSDGNGDGWNVHEWLKRAYAKEKVPLSENSITWLLGWTAKEVFVEVSGRNVWSALQHAVRTVLCHERHNRSLQKILNLSEYEFDSISQQHLDAISQLMAFRVSGRVLLPMVVAAGSFLQIRGFDWIQDDMTQRQYLQALPGIHTAWCNVLLDCVDRVGEYIQLEYEQCLEQLEWTRKSFIHAISQQHSITDVDNAPVINRSCTQCGADYSTFPEGLVSPTRITTMECVQTFHQLDCICQELHSSNNGNDHTELPSYAGSYVSGREAEDLELEDDFQDAEPYQFSEDAFPSKSSAAIFSGVATLLYRAHGRRWMGRYAKDDNLCATCFLLRERYTDEEGLIAEFPPIPEQYQGLRFRW